jgi:hypothetical protein
MLKKRLVERVLVVDERGVLGRLEVKRHVIPRSAEVESFHSLTGFAVS